MRLLRHLLSRALFFLCIIVVYFSFAHSSAAATLFVSPASVSVHAGDVFSVSIRVNTESKPINAVSAKLLFPKQLLQATGVSKSGSILNFWVQDPTISNTLGSVSFEGVAVNPGYSGSSGKIASVSFRALKEGTANLTLSQGSVLANDGEGTAVLSSVSRGIVTITKSIPSPEVLVPPESIPVVEEIIIPVEKEEISIQITSIPQSANSRSHFFIKGSTNGTTPIALYVQKMNEPSPLSSTIEYDAPTTALFDKSFPTTLRENTFTGDISGLSPGAYAFFAKDTDGNVSNIVIIPISGGFLSTLYQFIVLWWYIPLLLLLLLFVILILRKIIKNSRNRRGTLPAHRRGTLQPQIADRYTTLLQKIELGVPLNLEERLFVQKLKQYLHTEVDSHQ